MKGLIQKGIAEYLELSDRAVEELILLMSMKDFDLQQPAYVILRNITEKRYYRNPVTRLTYTLENHLPTTTSYVEKETGFYKLTRQGRVRLRDLCELANASPSSITQLNEEGFRQIRNLRRELEIFPFTNGRSTKEPLKERTIEDHCVYAVLLSENALQLRYRALNPNHNPRLPSIYVGMSKYTPRKRFDTHRFGRKKDASSYVYHDGLCLVPLIYSHLNTRKMTREEALQTEKKLAAALRSEGFPVFSGHHDKPKRFKLLSGKSRKERTGK